MNNSWSWFQGLRCYEKVRLVHDMCYSKLWAQGFGRYEQLRVVNDMNNLGSRGFRPLDAMNNSELWMIWTILGCEPKPLFVSYDRALKSMTWGNKFGLHYLFNDVPILLLSVLIPCIILYEHSCLYILHYMWIRCIRSCTKDLRHGFLVNRWLIHNQFMGLSNP